MNKLCLNIIIYSPLLMPQRHRWPSSDMTAESTVGCENSIPSKTECSLSRQDSLSRGCRGLRTVRAMDDPLGHHPSENPRERVPGRAIVRTNTVMGLLCPAGSQDISMGYLTGSATCPNSAQEELTLGDIHSSLWSPAGTWRIRGKPCVLPGGPL